MSWLKQDALSLDMVPSMMNGSIPGMGWKSEFQDTVAMRLRQGCLDALKRRCSDNKSGQLSLTLQLIAFCNGYVENSFLYEY